MDDLVIQVGFEKKHKRVKREYTYECLSDTQKELCGVAEPSKVACREGCPFLKVGKAGIRKEQKLAMFEKRLVNFEASFDEVIGKWARKQKEYLAQDKVNDAYIVRRIIEILCEPDLKVAHRKMGERVMKTELPLFRNYYREAREDVKGLRAILANHEKYRKMKEKMKL